PHLKRAEVTVALRSSVEQLLVINDLAGGREGLPRWAGVDIALAVERKLIPAEGAVGALRLIDNRDMGRDLLVVDEPVECWRRAVGRVSRQSRGLDAEALLGPLDHRLRRTDFGLADRTRGLDIHDDAALNIDQVVVRIGKECRAAHRASPLRRGSDGDTNFGLTSVAAPKAASSSVARYSLTARLAAAGSRSVLHSLPGTERCLLASATIRLASTANPSAPTRSAAIQASTTRSNTRRRMSLSRNRSLRARVKAEWSGILSSMLKPQNHRYARFTCTSRQIARSERIANT